MKPEDVDKLAKGLLRRAGGGMEIWILRKLLIAELKEEGEAKPDAVVDKFLLEAVADKDLDDYCTEPFGTSTRLCLTEAVGGLSEAFPSGPVAGPLRMAPAPLPAATTAAPLAVSPASVRTAMYQELPPPPSYLECGQLAERVSNHFESAEDKSAARNLVFIISAKAMDGSDPDFMSRPVNGELRVWRRR